VELVRRAAVITGESGFAGFSAMSRKPLKPGVSIIAVAVGIALLLILAAFDAMLLALFQ